VVGKINKIKTFTDNRGNLLPIEFDIIGFTPKRIFVINDTPINCIRGEHAHYETNQYLICIKGVVEVFLDDGTTKEMVVLNENESVLIPKMVWGYQKYIEEGSQLIVIASTIYNPDDYILGYDKFLTIKNGK
tara:strand:+ start:8534 stop:8929 length:396 start_codon:yes stop_codon:yes gene_type:complete